MIKLTPQQSNRLAISQQLIRIKLLEQALEYVDHKEKHILFGEPVGKTDLVQARNYLIELDRKRSIYESEAYQKKELPYLPSGGSSTDKVKVHFDAMDGELLFFEIKPSTTGKSVVMHQESKSHIKKRIKQKQMAQKKAAKKKVAKKKAAAPKKKAGGPTLKSLVDDMAWDGKTNEQIIAVLDRKKIDYQLSSVRWYASKARQTEKDAKK